MFYVTFCLKVFHFTVVKENKEGEWLDCWNKTNGCLLDEENCGVMVDYATLLMCPFFFGTSRATDVETFPAQPKSFLSKFVSAPQASAQTLMRIRGKFIRIPAVSINFSQQIKRHSWKHTCRFYSFVWLTKTILEQAVVNSLSWTF